MELRPKNQNILNSKHCKNIDNKWSPDLQSELLELAEKYDKNWKEISKRFSFFGEIECSSKYVQLSSYWNSDQWTDRENFILERFSLKNVNKNWHLCSVFMETKSPINCRNEWEKKQANFDINRQWGEEEQSFIFKMIQTHGFSWKTISENLWARTPNKVKNLFYSQIKKIKDSKIGKFLKLMICFPTCANKSKCIENPKSEMEKSGC